VTPKQLDNHSNIAAVTLVVTVHVYKIINQGEIIKCLDSTAEHPAGGGEGGMCNDRNAHNDLQTKRGSVPPSRSVRGTNKVCHEEWCVGC
jgi:hypothetical protein